MVTINSEQELQSALAFIEANEVLAYDTETTGLNPRKDTIIGFGFSNDSTGYYCPIYSYDAANDELVAFPLSSVAVPAILRALALKKLLMFNASFDARFTKLNLGVDLLPALHTDVLLLKHTCDEEFPFGLKELAVKHWGTDVKKEKEEMQASIKANGGTAAQYYKASTETLAHYCVQDCLLTFKLYNLYSAELKRQGLYDFYYFDEVLPLYKECTIPMEEIGVRLDIPKMQTALKEITEDIDKTEQGIQASIIPHLSIFTTWFLNKDYPKQTATGKQPVWARKGLTQQEAWERDYPGEFMFNLQSKHHLKKLFFDTLKETPLNRTPTGLPQVDEEFLEAMSQKYDWCAKLTVFNKLQKIKSTYIERFLEEAEGDRFFARFMQHRTTSGRMSGDLQQLPRPLESGDPMVVKYTNQVRSFILPDIGCKLVDIDYQQLEPTVFSHTSGDPALQAIFNEGKDFYSDVAIKTERLRDVSSDKRASNYLGKVNKAARQKAKSYSLGLAYGMSAYKLKFELNCTEQEAERLVNDYMTAFPELASWMNRSKETVKYKGQIATQSGRIRHMPRAAAIFKKYGSCIDNDLNLWKNYNAYPDLYVKAKEDRREYKNLLNNAINHQVQGLAASIVNRASIALVRKLKSEKLSAEIISQVHDELLLNCPESELERVCVIVKDILENIVKLAVPLKADPQVGDCYADTK